MRGVIFFCLKKEPTGFLFPLRFVHAWWWYAVQVDPKGGSRSLLFNVTTRKCRSFRPCPLSVNDVWETKTISIYSLPLFASFFLNSGVCYDRKVKRKLRKKNKQKGNHFQTWKCNPMISDGHQDVNPPENTIYIYTTRKPYNVIQ